MIFNGKKGFRKLMASCLVVLMMVTMLPTTSMKAEAWSVPTENLEISDATYYDSGAIKSLKISFKWGLGSASACAVLMTERLRSAGEEGTNSKWGDFTDRGEYADDFTSIDAVKQDSRFGVLANSDFKNFYLNTPGEITFNIPETAIKLDTDQLYYVYLWTTTGGKVYPDNLLLAINVDGGVAEYAVATDRNSYDAAAFEKVVAQNKYDVTVTPAANMTRVATSGAESQTGLNVPMTPVTYTANDGYYFPDTYAVESTKGIKVTRISETQITVSGMPTDNVVITLAGPEKKAVALEDKVFSYAYDAQRNPAYPKEGQQMRLWSLIKPYVAPGEQTESAGQWTLTNIGAYGNIMNSNKDSSNLLSIVNSVVSNYDNISKENIVIHELKKDGNHIAYGVTLAYDAAPDNEVAVFVGDTLRGGAGYVLSATEQKDDVNATASIDVTDWVAPQVYEITVAPSENGTAELSISKTIAGDLVEITATPKDGYKVASVKYNDGTDHEITLKDGKYIFTMPAEDVTVTVTYEKVETEDDNDDVPVITPTEKPENPEKPSTTVKTGDESQMFIWLALAVLSSAIVVAERKKRSAK